MAPPQWYRAVDLDERIACGGPAGEVDGNEHDARQRLEQWLAQYPGLSGGGLAPMLAARGIAADEFLRVVAEPTEALRNRLNETPPWQQIVESAFAAADAIADVTGDAVGVPGRPAPAD
jgi:hypothetical protein